jgi:hypothetical protein
MILKNKLNINNQIELTFKEEEIIDILPIAKARGF